MDSITPGKRVYQVNIFFISPQKHTLSFRSNPGCVMTLYVLYMY